MYVHFGHGIIKSTIAYESTIENGVETLTKLFTYCDIENYVKKRTFSARYTHTLTKI